MKLRSTGRLIALASVAAIAFAACSDSGASTAPSAAASAAASAGASGSAAAGALTVGYLPKDIVNQYFAAAADGAVEPPELEHAANATAAMLVRAIPRASFVNFKAVPPLSMTTLAHHAGPSRPAGDDPRGPDRWPTWPGEQRWG